MNRVEHDGAFQGYHIRCPGCDGFHRYRVGFHFLQVVPHPKRPHWQFNGNERCPTFSPSVKVHGPFWIEERQEWINFICHFFITDGRIRYLADCTHQLAGQTIAMVPY